MPQLSVMRHQQIFDPYAHNPPVTIIGAGATGSRIWLALVELGLTNIEIWDFDKIEAHNLPNQIYGTQDVGKYKVDALRDYYTFKTGEEPPESMKFHNFRVAPESKHSLHLFKPSIVFLLTDTMSSRREIFDGLIKGKCPFMIETRMASSYGNVYTVNPFDENASQEWIDSLIDDDDAETSACGASISVGPTAAIIANLAVWQFINFCTNPVAIDKTLEIHLKPTILTAKAA